MDVLLVTALVVAALALLAVVHHSTAGGRRAFAGPLVTIAGASAPGVARLAGSIRPIGEPPVSEASGRPWGARDLRITPGGDGDSASTRPSQQAVEFLLDDGTGVALVRARDAAVRIERDHEMPRTTLDQVPWVDAILRAGGYRNGSPSTCTIRLHEGVL